MYSAPAPGVDEPEARSIGIAAALLRRASRELALVAAFFNLVSIAIEGVAAVSLATALLPLGSAAYLSAFAPEQIHGAMLSIRRTPW